MVTVLTVAAVVPFSANAGSTLFSKKGTFFNPEPVVEYSFKLKNNDKVKITFKSDVPSILIIAADGGQGKSVVDVSDKTSYTKTVSLKKGAYYVMIFALGIVEESTETYKYSLTGQSVGVAAKDIRFKSSKASITIGSKKTLAYTTSPKGSIAKSVKWTSSDKKVATVDQNGVVTAKGFGKAVITAKLANGNKTRCTVSVTKQNIYLYKGDKKTLPKIKGKTVNWKSSNKKIAYVKSKIAVSKKVGKTTFKVKYKKTNYTLNVYVVDYKTVYKNAVKKLKSELDINNDPYVSLKINHIYKGYNKNGQPTVVLDFTVKDKESGQTYLKMFNSYSYYFSGSKKKYTSSCSFTEKKPKLVSQKKVK